MASSPPRQTQHRNGAQLWKLAAKEFESSNSTVTKFLGGMQKSWMTSSPAAKDGSFQGEQGRPILRKQGKHKQPFKSTIDNVLEISMTQPEASQRSEPVFSPPTPVSANNPTRSEEPSGPPKGIQQNVDDTLPSPAPSEEPYHLSDHVIDLENVESEQVSNEHHVDSIGISSRGDPPNPAEGNRSIDETNHAFAAAEPRRELSKELNSPVITEHSDDTTSAMKKRPQENETDSRKRIQAVSGQSQEAFCPDPLTNPLPCDSPSSSPSELDLRVSSERVESRILSITSMRPRKGDFIEIPRLRLLRDACREGDVIYFIIHQLYCSSMGTVDSGNLSIQCEFDFISSGASAILSDLLISNTEMVDDALRWFSTFPLPVEQMLQKWPGLRVAYTKALDCLRKLSQNWLQYRSRWRNRHCPVQLDEMITILGVDSIVLQRVINRAICRDVWFGPLDKCFTDIEKIFHQTQQAFQLRAFQSTSPQDASMPSFSINNQRYETAYKDILARHQQHVQVALQSKGSRAQTHSRISDVLPGQSLPSAPLTTSFQSNIPNSVDLRISPTTLPSSPLEMALAYPHTPQTPRTTLISPVPVHTQRLPVQTNQQIHPRILASKTRNINHQRNFVPARIQTQMPPPQRMPYNPLSVINGPLNNLENIARTQNPYLLQKQIQQMQNLTQRPSPPSFNSVASQPLPIQPQSAQGINFSFVTSAAPGLQLPHPGSVHHGPLNQPNPDISALHQVHAGSPILVPVDESQMPDNFSRLFSFVEHLNLMPNTLGSEKRHVRWMVEVGKNEFESLAPAKALNRAAIARLVRPGCRLYRLRCIKVAGKKDISEADWVIMDTDWPSGIAVLFNGKALEIRRKVHYGKDLPIDITSYVKEGQNTISVAITRPKQAEQLAYTVGLEAIQFTDMRTIKQRISSLEPSEALRQIQQRAQFIDPEVEVLDSAIHLNLTDPFMSKIFNIPVRGRKCRHTQCFDLDVFLQTRKRKSPTYPSSPDQFRCPICGADARPQTLFIDPFFLKIRQDLESMGRLHVKAVVLDEKGEWKIKEVASETGDTDTRPASPSSRCDSSNELKKTVFTTREPEYIDLIDD